MPFEVFTIKNPAVYLAQNPRYRPSTSPQATHRHRRHKDEANSTLRPSTNEHRHREHRKHHDAHFNSVQSENVPQAPTDKSRSRPVQHHQELVQPPKQYEPRNNDLSPEGVNYHYLSSKHHSRRETDNKVPEAEIQETRVHRSHRRHHKHGETLECIQSVDEERVEQDSRVRRVYQRSTEVTMHQHVRRDPRGLAPHLNNPVHYRTHESSHAGQHRVADRPKRHAVNRVEGTTWSTTMYPTPIDYLSAGARGVFDKIKKTFNIGRSRTTKTETPAESINVNRSRPASRSGSAGPEAAHVVRICVGVEGVRDHEETKELPISTQTDVPKSAEKCDIAKNASAIVVAPCVSEVGKALTRKDGNHKYGESEESASERSTARRDGIISTPSDALSVLTSGVAWAETAGLSDISLKDFMEYIKHKRNTSAKPSNKSVKTVESKTSRDNNSLKKSTIKLHDEPATKVSGTGVVTSRVSITSSCSTCKVKSSNTRSRVLDISGSKPSSLNGSSDVSSTVTITGDTSATSLRSSAIPLEDDNHNGSFISVKGWPKAEISLLSIKSNRRHRSQRSTNVKDDLKNVSTASLQSEKEDVASVTLKQEQVENESGRSNVVRAQLGKVIAESVSEKKVMSPQNHRPSVKTRNINAKSDLNEEHTSKMLSEKDITTKTLQERYMENLKRKKHGKVDPSKVSAGSETDKKEGTSAQSPRKSRRNYTKSVRKPPITEAPSRPSLKQVSGAKKDLSSESLRLMNKPLREPLRKIRSDVQCESTERSSASSTEAKENDSSESMKQRLSNYKNPRTRRSRSNELREDLSSESMKLRHGQTMKKKFITKKKPKVVLEFGFLGESTDEDDDDCSSSESSRLRRSFKKIPRRRSTCGMVDFSAENVDEMPRFVQVMPALVEASSLEELNNNNNNNNDNKEEAPKPQPPVAKTTARRVGRLPVPAPRRLKTPRTPAQKAGSKVSPPRSTWRSRESKSRHASVERPLPKDNKTPRAKSQEAKAKPPPKVAAKTEKPTSAFAQNMARLKKRNAMFREKARVRRMSLNSAVRSDQSSGDETSRSRSRRTLASPAMRGNSGYRSRDASSDSGGDHTTTPESHFKGTARGQPEQNKAGIKKSSPQRSDNKRVKDRSTKAIFKCLETSPDRSTRTESHKRKQESVMKSASSLKALGRVDFSEEGLGNLPKYVQIMPCDITHKPGYKKSGKLLTSDEFLAEAEEQFEVKAEKPTSSAILLAKTVRLLERGEELQESFLKNTASKKSTASRPAGKRSSKFAGNKDKRSLRRNTQSVYTCVIPEHKKQDDNVTRQKVKKAATTFGKRGNTGTAEVPARKSEPDDNETALQRNSSQGKEIKVEDFTDPAVSRHMPVKVEDSEDPAVSRHTSVKVEDSEDPAVSRHTSVKESAVSIHTPSKVDSLTAPVVSRHTPAKVKDFTEPAVSRPTSLKVESLSQTVVSSHTPVKVDSFTEPAVARSTPVPRPRGNRLSSAVEGSKYLNTTVTNNETIISERQDKERVVEGIDKVIQEEKTVEVIDNVNEQEKSNVEGIDKVMLQEKERGVEGTSQVIKQEIRTVKVTHNVNEEDKSNVEGIDKVMQQEKERGVEGTSQVIKHEKRTGERTDKVMKQEKSNVEVIDKEIQQETITLEGTDNRVSVASSDSMKLTKAIIKPKSFQSSNRVFEVKHVDSEENTSTTVKSDNVIPSRINPEHIIEKTKSENITTSTTPCQPTSKSESVAQLEPTSTSSNSLSRSDNQIPFEVSVQTIVENVKSETATPLDLNATSVQRTIGKTNVNCVDIAYVDSEASSDVETDTDYEDVRSCATTEPEVDDISETDGEGNSARTSGDETEDLIGDLPRQVQVPRGTTSELEVSQQLLDTTKWPGLSVSAANSSSLMMSLSSSNTSLGEHNHAYLQRSRRGSTYGDQTSERTDELSVSGTESPLEYQTYSQESLVSSTAEETAAELDQVTLPSRDDLITNINEKIRRNCAETVLQTWSRDIPNREAYSDVGSLSSTAGTSERCNSLSPVSSTSLNHWRNPSDVVVQVGRDVAEPPERFSLTRVLARERLLHEEEAEVASVPEEEAGFTRERGRNQGAIPRYTQNENLFQSGKILPIPKAGVLNDFAETRSHSEDTIKGREQSLNDHYLGRGEDQLAGDNDLDALLTTTSVNQPIQDELLLNETVHSTDDLQHPPGAYLHTVGTFRSRSGLAMVEDCHPLFGVHSNRQQYDEDTRNQTTQDSLVRVDKAPSRYPIASYVHDSQGIAQHGADVNSSSRENSVPVFNCNANVSSTTPPQTAEDLISVRETREDVLSVPQVNAQQSFATTLKSKQDLVEVKPISATEQQTLKIHHVSVELSHLEIEAPTSRKQLIPDKTKTLKNAVPLDRSSNVNNQVPSEKKHLGDVYQISRELSTVESKIRETHEESQLNTREMVTRGGQELRDKQPNELILNFPASKATDQLRSENISVTDHRQLIDTPRAQMRSLLHQPVPSTRQDIHETRLASPDLEMHLKRLPSPEHQTRVPSTGQDIHETRLDSPGLDMHLQRVPSTGQNIHETRLTSPGLDMHLKREPSPEHHTRVLSTGQDIHGTRLASPGLDTNLKRVPSPEHHTRVLSTGQGINQTRLPSPGVDMHLKRVPSPEHETRLASLSRPTDSPDRSRSAKCGSPRRRPPLTSPPPHTARPPSPGRPTTDTSRKKKWYQKIIRGKKPTPSTLELDAADAAAHLCSTIQDIYHNVTCASQDDVTNQSESGLIYPHIIEETPKHAFKRYPR